MSVVLITLISSVVIVDMAESHCWSALDNAEAERRSRDLDRLGARYLSTYKCLHLSA